MDKSQPNLLDEAENELNNSGEKSTGIKKYEARRKASSEKKLDSSPREQKNNDTGKISIIRVEKKKESKERAVVEKTMTAKERKNSRFSTHGKAALVVTFTAIFIIVTIFSALLSYQYLIDKTENPVIASEVELDPETTVKFRVTKGERASSIGESLEKEGLIKNATVFKVLSKFNGYDSLYKSGIHYLSKGLTYDEIMAILSDEPETVKVTFPEGFTTIQIAERLEANGVCTKEEFLNEIKIIDVSSYSFLTGLYPKMDYALDGFLFPDTYTFEIDSDPSQVIYKLLNRFNDIFIPEYYERIEKLGLSVHEVVTIASYVEKEAKLQSERETIARVYYNRLISEEFTLMQCDATVLYALKKIDPTITTITKEDLSIDDPYNTYLYEGLTPGPICSPSSASIKAVITMDEHDYYYYVAKSDGSGGHIFSKTLEEHEAAIEKVRGQNG